MPSRLALGLPLALLVGLAGACGDDDGASCSNPGGPVPGDPNTHCTETVTVDEATCHPPDAGPTDPDAGPVEADPAPVAGTEGDDDDCKYYVQWSSSTICENADVNFTLTLTVKDGNAPATGANPYIEAFLNETHPAPNSDATSRETSPGVYDIGPMRFDAPGRWTIRFHYYGDCNEGETSPHSHAAYFLDVP